MKTKCPACGATFSLDVLLTHEGARGALMTALQMPAPLGKLLVQYLALFRPATRDLSFDRVSTLLGELLPMIQAGQIERNGRAWPAPLAAWQTALEQMLMARDRLQLPMKSHGYLLEIIAGMGNKAEAAAEQQREENRQRRAADKPAAGDEKPRAAPPPEFMALVKKMSQKSSGGDNDSTDFEAKRRASLKALAQLEESKNGSETKSEGSGVDMPEQRTNDAINSRAG